jgi:hypothetical protein
MTSLPPLLSGGPAPQPAPSSAELTVVDAPAELNALQPGTRLAATVLSSGTGGTGGVAIRTAFGILIAESAAMLQKGASVSLLVRTAAPGMVLRITQMAPPHGEQTSVPAPRGPAAFVVAPGVTPSIVAGYAARESAKTGVEFAATVLRPFSGMTSGATPGPAGPADVAAEPRFPFPAGTRLSLRIPTAGPTPTGASHGDPSPVASRSRVGQTITASVIRTDGAGRPLLASSAGPLLLATPVHFPPQWTGELEILELTPPPPANLLAAPTGSGGFQPKWQTLEHILGVLSGTDPATARHVRETVLPQPTSSLAANLLAVLGLLRHGDIRGWIGDDAHRALAQSRPDLLDQLGAEVQELAPRSDRGAGGDWRIFSIPMMVDGVLAAITMLVRHRPQPDSAGGSEDGDSTRFVVDLVLSRLGRMQIDGLLQAHGRQLDLMVRTECPLAADVQAGIRSILAEATAITGLGATVCFRAAPAHFLDAVILAGANRDAGRSLVV